MFAGPNGSGKSTLKTVLPPALLGVYINPDEIEQDILTTGSLDLANYQVVADGAEVLSFLQNSQLLGSAARVDFAASLKCVENRLSFSRGAASPYLASVLADFLRRKLLAGKISFTFETVMSSPDKVALLQTAQRLGYRTYLYYIATDDPEINISRVRNRVRLGGHPVPEDKIVSRYARSLNLLTEAIAYTNRAYIFDNSTHDPDRNKTWLAEITDGHLLEMKTDQMPAWFKRAVWDKVTRSA
jgi:predicted ABC-type ATPase